MLKIPTPTVNAINAMLRYVRCSYGVIDGTASTALLVSSLANEPIRETANSFELSRWPFPTLAACIRQLVGASVTVKLDSPRLKVPVWLAQAFANHARHRAQAAVLFGRDFREWVYQSGPSLILETLVMVHQGATEADYVEAYRDALRDVTEKERNALAALWLSGNELLDEARQYVAIHLEDCGSNHDKPATVPSLLSDAEKIAFRYELVMMGQPPYR